MKAILIARVSTEEQREAGNSLPAQINRLEKYCNNKGLSILNSFSFDESAYKTQRDDFDKILDFVLTQQEKVAVCCDKVDRLSRNMFDTRVSKLYERALEDKLELHFVSDGQVVNSRISAAEKFQFSISLGLAKYYSDAVSDNVKRSFEQKLRKGEWPGKAPYGYQNIKKPESGTDIIVDEFAAFIVQKAFEWYATSAYSMGLLLEKLKKECGVTWSKGFLDKILKNPFYYGSMRLKGSLYPHRYPALITKALFDQVQQVKTGFNKKPFKYAGKPYIYRGLLRCAHCGLSVTPEKHKGFVYYHCTQYNGKHDAKWLREEEITRQLSDIFQSLQMPKEVAQRIIETLSEVHKNKMEFQAQQLAKLTVEQKSLTKMMDNLYIDKLKGRITESEYDKFYQTFKEQLTDINIRLDQIQQAEESYYLTTKYLLVLSQQVFDIFVSSEVEEKRQLMKLVLSNLRIEGENVVCNVQKPFDLILECSEDQRWPGPKVFLPTPWTRALKETLSIPTPRWLRPTNCLSNFRPYTIILSSALRVSKDVSRVTLALSAKS